MENNEWLSLANLNKLSTSSFMMAVDTYAEQGNSAISDPVEDIIKHKVNTPPPPFFLKCELN